MPTKPGTAPGTAVPNSGRIHYTPVSVRDLKLTIPGKQPSHQHRGDSAGNLFQRFSTTERNGTKTIMIHSPKESSNKRNIDLQSVRGRNDIIPQYINVNSIRSGDLQSYLVAAPNSLDDNRNNQ